MKKMHSNLFRLNAPVTMTLFTLGALFATSAAAGGGFGPNTNQAGQTIDVPTYYASSPSGWAPSYDPATHDYTGAMVNSGKAIRKFVNGLPGLTEGNKNNLGQYLPVAGPLLAPEKWVNMQGVTTKDDYYEFAAVEYTEQVHSDFSRPTRLRAYVQLETPYNATRGSKHFPLCYPQAVNAPTATVWANWPHGPNPNVYVTNVKTAACDPILYPSGPLAGTQVFAYDKPHYLGPIILAVRDTSIRHKFYNFLPPNQELFIPTDRTVSGAGEGVGGRDPATGLPIDFQFPDSRIAIHWHGGDSPWISDGTPHQWWAPANEKLMLKDGTLTNTLLWNVGLGKGVSAVNVPDMPDPGPGAYTFYWPNHMDSRLMFYHDHTSGLTRLNVYVGTAAGLVVIDPVEEDGLRAVGVPGTLGTVLDLSHTIPLVIQDRGFVPDNIGTQAPTLNGLLQSQDAKWDLAHWGQPGGDFWFAHVYETNQDPTSIDGTNPVGRWDWGPWFWPVFPAQYSLPTGEWGKPGIDGDPLSPRFNMPYSHVSTTPEAFQDTPFINGTVYPTITVDPTAYRFRILNAANDRTMNLSLFVADPAIAIAIDPDDPAGTRKISITGTEIRMVPATPTAGFPASWPIDGRVGGVPDPTLAGPDFVQIGSEAGLLPVPAIWPAQPISYDMNVRSITVFNVLNHGILLGGGERADAIADFSKFAGQTLILYNDAPAPTPGNDPRIDYFTNEGDYALNGAAFNTHAGYGPNTRTLMQIKVRSKITDTATLNPVKFDEIKFKASGGRNTKILASIYAKAQPKPLIPESIFNDAFGTSDGDNYAQIYVGGLSNPQFQFTSSGLQTLKSIKLLDGGTGYNSVPTVQLVGGGGTGAIAQAVLDPILHKVTSVTLVSPGANYTSAPAVKFINALGDGGMGASGMVLTTNTNVITPINKAIQELFDPVYGRMNATLAMELPRSNNVVATTIPLWYIDPPVDPAIVINPVSGLAHPRDSIQDGEVQIWKITHNGVDSHPVHFHMVNLQLINRVDWAGTIKPPKLSEAGWKETILMSPLEDVYVALRAKNIETPFGMPRSQRLVDPAQPAGGMLGFTQIDPLTGQTPVNCNAAAPAIPGVCPPAMPVNTVSWGQNYMLPGALKNTLNSLKPIPVPLIIPVVAAGYSNEMTDYDNEYVFHCHILGHEEFDFMRPFIFHPSILTPDPIVSTAVAGSITWTDLTPQGGVDANTGTPVLGNPKNEVGFYITAGAPVAVVPPTVPVYPAASGCVYPAPSNCVHVAPSNSTSWINPAVLATYVATPFNSAGMATAKAATTVPVSPTNVNAMVNATTSPAIVNVTWHDVTPSNAAGYIVQRLTTTSGASCAAANTGTALNLNAALYTEGVNSRLITDLLNPVQPAALPAPAVQLPPATISIITNSYIDSTGVAGQSYCYSVIAKNSAGSSLAAVQFPPTAVTIPTASTAATTLASPAGLTQTLSPNGKVTFTWSLVNGATSYIVTVNGVSTTVAGTSLANQTVTNTNVTVAAVNASGQTFSTTSLYNGTPLQPFVTAKPGLDAGDVTFVWANDATNINNVASIVLTWRNGVGPWVTKSFAPTSSGVTIGGLASGVPHTFTIKATSSLGNSPVQTFTVTPN